MTLNIDVAPTLLSLAGAPVPPSMEGRSLLPLLAPAPSPPWRREWYYSHLFEHPAIPKSEGVRTAEWKYFRFLDTPQPYEALLHVAEDPLEERNLAGAASADAQVDALRRRVRAWNAALTRRPPDTPWQDPE